MSSTPVNGSDAAYRTGGVPPPAVGRQFASVQPTSSLAGMQSVVHGGVSQSVHAGAVDGTVVVVAGAVVAGVVVAGVVVAGALVVAGVLVDGADVSLAPVGSALAAGEAASVAVAVADAVVVAEVTASAGASPALAYGAVTASPAMTARAVIDRFTVSPRKGRWCLVRRRESRIPCSRAVRTGGSGTHPVTRLSLVAAPLLQQEAAKSAETLDLRTDRAPTWAAASRSRA